MIVRGKQIKAYTTLPTKKQLKSKKKPSTFKKGYTFSDGSSIRKKFFFNNDKNFIIYTDTQNTIRYKSNEDVGCLDNLNELGQAFTEISMVPDIKIGNFILFSFKKDLNLLLAKTIEIALLNNEKVATHNIKNLLIRIEDRKIFLKKIVFLGTPILFTLIFYLLYFGYLNKFKIISSYNSLILFSAFGNFISTITNINKIEFSSFETPIYYVFFSAFKYTTSIISSILLILLYNSKIVSITFNFSSNIYLVPILSTLGGYAEQIVPNIFDSLSKSIIDK